MWFREYLENINMTTSEVVVLVVLFFVIYLMGYFKGRRDMKKKSIEDGEYQDFQAI